MYLLQDCAMGYYTFPSAQIEKYAIKVVRLIYLSERLMLVSLPISDRFQVQTGKVGVCKISCFFFLEVFDMRAFLNWT